MGKKRDNISYTDWETPERLDELEKWAAQGLLLDEIARNMGIARSTLYLWRKSSEAISTAIKRGEESIIDRVEHALIDSAIEDRNITAMIFYLKNKRPNDWRDKRENEISGGNGGKVSFEWGAKEKPSYINKEENETDVDNK